LEAAGRVTLEEEKNSMEILTKQLKSGLNIKASDIDSDDSSDSEWESSSESSSETSSEEEESSCSNEED
jgi:replicative DNA helicase